MPSPVHVILSGCHAGPNPSPGLGVARSLRLAYPDARLIARDFSAGATGLHDDVFGEVWLCPAWEDSDLELARRQLERGAVVLIESAVGLPGAGRRCLRYGDRHGRGRDGREPAACHRRPGRKTCPGRIAAHHAPDGRIAWQCSECGDQGWISNWRGTPWDAGGAWRA